MKGLSESVKIHELQRFYYSVRQKVGDPGSISTQNMFPLISVVPKPPESPYGATYVCFAENLVFNFFPFLLGGGGSFSQMNFRRRPFNQKPLVFRTNPRTHLEVQGHLVMKGLPKNVKNHEFWHSWKVPSSPNDPWTSRWVLGFFLNTRGLWLNGLRRKSILGNDPPKKTGNWETSKKNACLYTTVSFFPRKSIFVGVIFQNGFSPKAVQPEAPGV